MGQKVHPLGLRLGGIKNWNSRWFVPNCKFGDNLLEDCKIRNFIKERLPLCGIANTEIEKTTDKVRIIIHTFKPGVVIGRNGSEIDKLKAGISKITSKTIALSVIEIKNPDMNAQLVSENVASQLERRIPYRKAVKQSIARIVRSGAKGVKIMVSGRLGGVEIARSEHYHEGTIPLQTLRADIEYGFAEADTTYGKIGVKVWIYKGEVFSKSSTKIEQNKNMPLEKVVTNNVNT
ncbi:MAG: 30S ribosomal protein S3 [Clostridiales bacterium]|jgi:small subunit ribosomal protein S3|nr:30S ribosomal protein S3 [Clostridiales bacterium]